MCGIAGILDPHLSREAIRAALRVMNQQIVHRGPDDEGSYAEAGVGIGMRRLSIIDLTGGQQPLANENGDIHVVCNGEIYNFRELRADLIRRGHRFRCHSDTEVIVHLYEEYGDNFLSHLRGMFGLAIWDAARQRLLIARDRLGKKPLFYAYQNGRFYFASEMKSLLAVAPELAAPDYRSLGQFFQAAFIHQPQTIYQHIHRLPAAHYAVVANGEVELHKYWELVFEADESQSEDQWSEQLDAMLAESVRVRLESEVPLGVFLSGGLDSSAIVAYAHHAGLRPLKTFTIGFDRPEWDESDDAQRVASHFGTEHHLLRISESDLINSFDDTLQRIVGHCDEPFGDASALPTYHVSRLAKEHVTVILSGDGGDELFAGYSSYRGALFAQQYRRFVPHYLGRYVFPTMANTAAGVLPHRLKYQALRMAKILADSALPFQQAYRDKTSIWRVDELRELLAPDLLPHVDYLGEQYLPEPLWQLLCDPRRDLVSRLTEIDIHSYMLDDILVKVDRMSMAHSLEVRSPLLDHHMVELAARMPTRMKIRRQGFHSSQGKYLFRKIMRPKLPARNIRKGKQGFSVPLRDWFRGKLSDLVQDYLGTGGYLPSSLFSATKVESILQEHRLGKVDHANKIWLLLTFAAWHRNYQCGNAFQRGGVAPVAPRPWELSPKSTAPENDGEPVSCES